MPTDDEYIQLEMYLGMSESEANSTYWRGTNEGSKLAGNADLWNNGDLENDSEFGTSGFNGLPAGQRHGNNGGYDFMGGFGYFWPSYEAYSISAWGRRLSYDYSSVNRFNYSKQLGISIRCLKD